MTDDQDPPARSAIDDRDGRLPKNVGLSPLLLILVLLAAVAIGVAIWATQSGERSGTPAANTADSPQAKKAPDAQPGPTSPAQLAAAFQSAFGKPSEAQLTTGDDIRTYRPSRLLHLDDLYVLLSEGRNLNDCHACSGSVAIHYLRQLGDGFELVGSWPDLVPGLGYGEPPEWTVSAEYNTYPTIHSEAGFTAQGCTTGVLWLTELRPDKPVQSEMISTYYGNASGMGERNGQTIEGKIRNIRKNASFEVAYSGAESFVEKWVKKGDVYRLEAGETRMPQC